MELSHTVGYLDQLTMFGYIAFVSRPIVTVPTHGTWTRLPVQDPGSLRTGRNA